ncbi:MAG: RIP metalloprotease RseP [Peptoniphilaceae bacterium]
MYTAIGSIFVFMLVILLHELGHFTVAKLSGIKVNEFSIGMGPKIFQKKSRETDYSIRILPIGGFVAMEGEEESSNDPRSFNNVSVYKRIAVVLAGVFMNVVLAILAFMLVGLILGIPSTTVSEVLENSPAEISQIKSGDKILKINEETVSSWDDITNNISRTKNNQKISVEVKRNDQILTKSLNSQLKDGRIIIGISPELKKDFFGSIKYGFSQTFKTISDVYGVLSSLIRGKVNVNNLAGPVGVISFIGQATSLGFVSLLRILGIISANLAVVNLLPIPALDGGKFVFLLYEAISGKKVNQKFEEILTIIGISLLLGLMIYVTIFGDLVRLNIFRF